MSFGSENPELWNEICRRGIENKLRAEMNRNGVDDIDEPTLEAVVEAVFEFSPKVFNILLDWANAEISNSEADYWGGKIDEVVMRHEAT